MEERMSRAEAEDLAPHLDAIHTGKLYEIGRDEFSLFYEPDAKIPCLTYYKGKEVISWKI